MYKSRVRRGSMKKRQYKPKVLIITSLYGGLGHYAVHLQEFLKKYCDLYFVTYKKHFLTSAKINKPGDSLISRNIKSAYYIIERDSSASLSDLIHLIKKLKIDLVNIHFGTTAMPLVPYYTKLCKKLKELKIPAVLTSHDVLLFSLPKNKIKALKLFYNEVGHFIVGNKTELKKLTDDFSISGNKATIIEHGVYNKFDMGKFTESSARKHFKLQNKPVILFFGFLRKYKGILTLIDSMKSVVKKEKNAVLHIAGSSNIENFSGIIRKKIKKNKLTKNIKFTDEFIPINQIEAVFKSADIVALPYISVSQSGVLSLALYFRKPVIITNIFAETPIVHKKMGLAVKPNNPKELANAILYILKNKDMAKKYGVAGYKYIEKYGSWDKIAKKMDGIFCRYLSRK